MAIIGNFWYYSVCKKRRRFLQFPTILSFFQAILRRFGAVSRRFLTSRFKKRKKKLFSQKNRLNKTALYINAKYQKTGRAPLKRKNRRSKENTVAKSPERAKFRQKITRADNSKAKITRADQISAQKSPEQLQSDKNVRN